MAARKLPKTLPIEVQARPGLPLGMPAEKFLRDYWQKRPLLIRGAFGDFQTPVTPEDLAGLACEEGSLSRLISHDGAQGDWKVRTGPFQEEDFPGLPDHDWTLLVQDVDKWDADVRALVHHFDFLPRWRMDDVMISFAATGGGVGAHVDQYDVFLLQAFGQRRWKIDASESIKGKRPSLDFQQDVELKLLKRFKATHDWVLAPGDMLYLPPNVPHDGVAVDPCLTFSFGMRAPSSAELISDYLDTLICDASEDIRYTDADLKRPEDPNEIDVVAMNRVVKALNAIRMNDPDRLGDWFGRFITTYRAAGEVMASREPIEAADLVQALSNGLVLERHPWTRLAWRRATKGAALFCSGLAFSLSVKDAQRLAAAESIDLQGYLALSAKSRLALLELSNAGHFQLLDPSTLDDVPDDELDDEAPLHQPVELEPFDDEQTADDQDEDTLDDENDLEDLEELDGVDDASDASSEVADADENADGEEDDDQDDDDGLHPRIDQVSRDGDTIEVVVAFEDHDSDANDAPATGGRSTGA